MEFDGEIRHAVTHRSAREFQGKECSSSAWKLGWLPISAATPHNTPTWRSSAPAAATTSFPNTYSGVPVDQLDDGPVAIPRWIERPVMTGLLRLIVGDLTRVGAAQARPPAL